ncbi:ABC transporter substrate-binding protein [Ancylobacter sp. MQZ15Z-1]|uniref:ABC transporter substrate-binding protein n=1 Tax=Ancylobacter mangrovi TaxID=2972472 RepID=A0A9X2PE82_9HYPH|nr:ABC transporter substrate-binding protein [Ancylobacter mangrovi]MCS0496270.1 ABC transporter substrate-binding protein [Ancylobacter mangrovi]
MATRRDALALAAALAAITLTPGAISTASADPVKIRIGWSTMPGHLIPVLYSKPDILKHYGKSYTVEPIRFRGSSPQITAMAAGEIDMAAFGPLVLALAVTNAHLDVKVVADIIQDGVNGSHSETFLVRADSGIEKVTDMKGKRVGTNAIGSASDTAMRAMFRKNKMQDKRDFTMVEVAFPNIPAMLDEGKIDLGTVLQPMSKQLLDTGKYKVLFTSSDAMGPSQLVFLAANGKFLDANRAALMDFFEDHVRAVRWFTDPKNRKEAIKIIADFMQQPPDSLSYLFTKEDYYRDPFMAPNVKSIQDSIDIAVDLGLAPRGIQVSPEHVDLSFVKEAQKRIEAGQ